MQTNQNRNLKQFVLFHNFHQMHYESFVYGLQNCVLNDYETIFLLYSIILACLQI